MEAVNFNQEIAEHIAWNVRLSCFLDGGECVLEKEAVSPRECGLGKWLYAEGMTTYGMITEIQELEKVHDQLHAIVRRIIQMKKSGDIDVAKIELTRLKAVNSKILTLIVAIEESINRAQG